MHISSQHHSFDIKLAARYGVEEAILIHHFQHWIRLNCYKQKNFRNGKTWSYQSRKDIQAHFPYWNVDRVKYLTEKLVEMGVLVTANYNKVSIDKTLWYAFVNPEEFGVTIEDSNSFYEGQKCPSMGKSARPEGKSAQAIPDTKKEDAKEKINKYRSATPPPTADAAAICDFFLMKIKERSPDFKEPNKQKWAEEIDRLLRIDKRDPHKVQDLIEWASEHLYWKGACLSPASLRKHYDQMCIQMAGGAEKNRIRENRKYALQIQQEYPKETKGLTFDSMFVMNKSTGKEIPFNLPEETFKDALIALFGGERG